MQFFQILLVLVAVVDGARYRREVQAHGGMLNGPDQYLDPARGDTVKGCTCTTGCKTSLEENYKIDWCKVPRSCKGRRFRPSRGFYDYCAYLPIPEFENQIALAKESQVWWRVVANKNPAPNALMPDAVKSALDQMAMRSIFDNWRDVKPRGQAKILHLQAVVCKFSMTVSRASPYTGIFAPGTTHGIMRMGSASLSGPFPGLSLKWFRNYVHSANIMMLRKKMKDGVTENYFDDAISNHVIPPQALDLVAKFTQATNCQAMLGLSDMGKYDQDGNAAGDALNFPFELLMEPVNRKLAAIPKDRANFTTELWKQLSSIPVGTKLYNVMTSANPGDAHVKIGELKTTSECANSYFGDTRLAFKHWRMEEDFALKPHWMPLIVEKLCKPESEWKE